MTKRKPDVPQPSLLDQAHMKDVTPKKSDIPPLTEGMVRKGGRNQGSSQIKERPAAPAAMNRPKSKAVAVAAPQAADSKSMIAIIRDIACSPNFNPEAMRQAVELEKDIMAEQAKREFAAAFVALQAELPVISATGRIEVRKKGPDGERTGAIQQSTPYATFNNIMDTIQPLLTKYGFGLSFETAPSPDGTRLLVTGTLEHGGHQRQSTFPLPAEVSGSKNNVQGWGSSMSYGKRYCTVALLNIRSAAPEDRDTDGYHVPNLQRGKGDKLVQVAEAERINKDQLTKLIDVMEDCGVSKQHFCQHYGIKGVAELPASLYQASLKELNDHKAKRGPSRNG